MGHLKSNLHHSNGLQWHLHHHMFCPHECGFHKHWRHPLELSCKHLQGTSKCKS